MPFYADYPDLDGLTTARQIEELYNKFLALSREVEYAVNHIDHKNVTPTFSKEMSNDRDNITKLEQTADNITISVANLERTVQNTSASLANLERITENTSAGLANLEQITENTSASLASLEQITENTSASVASLEQITENTSAGLASLERITENKVDKTAAYYQFDSAALTIYSAGLKIRKGTPESPGEQVFYADNEGNLCLREICLVDEEGKIAAKVIQGGIGLHAITLYDIAHENEYGLIYVDENSPRLIIGGGGYGLSHIGNNPAVDNGVEIGSGYKRPISATPTEPEKKQHSGITLTGDVVISNFADDYYRYPVIGDANYKTRLYLENDAIKFALFNPVTDAVVNTYTLIPDSVN